jgi:acetylornithine deacetylase/succinyl-diaminopimelate desuccinylase-like protein
LSAIGALVEDTLAIARIPAPTFEEATRIDWIQHRLAQAPGRRRRDHVGNLIWEWGDSQPRLVICAHVDTVFGNDVVLDCRRDGDYLVGPGIGDNAVAVAMVIHVAEKLLRAVELAPAAIAFTVGEEGQGNLRGAYAACLALRPRALIAVEGHGLDRIFVDAVGSVRASLAVRGPGGHSWADRNRPSAIHALLQLGLSCLRLSDSALVVNIGSITGGRSVNVIADQSEMVLEARSLDEPRLDSFSDQLSALRVPVPLAMEVTMIGRRPAGRLPRDEDLLRVVRAARAELGLTNTEDAASTDANAGLACGIPSLALGAAIGAAMHTTAEYIEVESLELGCRQLETVMRQLLTQAGSAADTGTAAESISA